MSVFAKKRRYRAKEQKKESQSSGFVAVAAKLSKLVKALKVAKFLKPAITLGSLLVSVVAYAFTLRAGWLFAVGFVLMILIHEMGHVTALRRKGLKASAPVFIPFVGAAIFAPKFGNRDEEAYVGYAGPLVGGTAAAVLLGWVVLTPHASPILRLVAYTALVINLFNLIPVSPLDGGRVTQAVGPWFKWVGVAILIGATLLLKDPGFILIWLLSLGSLPMKNMTRAVLAVAFFVTMATMELARIGVVQSGAWIVVDLSFGLLFTAMYVSDAKRPERTVSDDTRPQLTGTRKVVWLAMYALLTVALIGLTIVGHRYLPIQATRS